MNEDQAQKAIIAASILGATVAVWESASAHGGNLDSPARKALLKQLLAVGVLAAALGIGASFAPQVAGPFALFLAFIFLMSRAPTIKEKKK